MFKNKKLINITVLTIILTLSTYITSLIFFYNLGNILFSLDQDDFGVIFTQLQNTTNIIPPILLIKEIIISIK